MKYFFKPIYPYIVNQPFGANGACYDPKTNKVIACDGKNPPQGYISLYGKNGHRGVDLRAYHGQEVYCALEGVIDSIDTNPRTGLDVRIISKIDGRTFKHIYEHLQGYHGKVGDKKLVGEIIGWADNTGWSAGDHLHFQIEEKINGRWVPIDPATVLRDVYAREGLKIYSLLAYVKERLAYLLDNMGDKLRR